MESSGAAHKTAHETLGPDLLTLLEGSGPFTSVYLDVTAGVEQAMTRAMLHWKNARRELERDGAPASALDAIEEALPTSSGEGDTLAVIADAERVRYRGFQPEPPARDVHRVGALPYVAPLVEWRQSMPNHAVVLADRTGADIVAFLRDSADIERHIEGDTTNITKVHPGGWSQRRFQQRAENTWEANATDVARTVTELVDRLGVRVVAAAGDVRATQLLKDELPDRVTERLHLVQGSRAEDGSVDEVAHEVTRLVATSVAGDTVALLEKFREERGQHDRAADGPARTIEALAAGRVETLLVHDDPDDERTCWIGPELAHIASDRVGIDALGAEDATEARLVDALIRAAAGTGAGVWIVPKSGGPTDGAGAILRW